MTEEVIDVVPISAETIPAPEEIATVVYDVTVTTKFQVTGPADVPDPRLLEKALWASMPGGYIGGELFVKFPPGSRNFNVKISAEQGIEEPQVIDFDLKSNENVEAPKAE